MTQDASHQPYGTPEVPRVAVRGEATLEVDPEIARIGITVSARGTDRRTALEDLTRRNNAVLDLIKSYGDPVEKLETGSFSITPELTRHGRGVVGVNGGDNLSFKDCYELQPRLGAPITYTAVLTFPNGAHIKAAEIHRRGMAAGADVWPQVSCRPLAFSVNLIEPNTRFRDYIHTLDTRFARNFRISRYRLQAMVDVYNILNLGTVTVQNQTTYHISGDVCAMVVITLVFGCTVRHQSTDL